MWRILLDTHYLLWSALNPNQMEPWARTLVADLKNTVLVSAISAYEIGRKVSLGKLPGAEFFASNLVENVDSLGFTFLAVSPAMMLRASRLPSEHKDPFERMIAACALELDIELLSIDLQMDSFGLRRLTSASSS